MSDINSPFVSLRNIISGVAQEYTEEQAQQFLNHPVFGQHLEIVRTDKPEVLSGPRQIDEDGKKAPIVEPEDDKAPEPKKDTK